MSQVNQCIWQLSQAERGRPDDVDGDEEPRSGGVAVVTETSRAEEPVDPPGVEPTGGAELSDDDGSAGTDGAEPRDEAAPGDDVVAVEGDGSPDEVAAAADPQGQAEAAPVTEATDVPAPRKRSSLRRGAVVGALALVVALAVSAFATAGSASGDVDQRFLDATRSQGLVVDSGQQQTLLVSAARKICDRRESHGTVAERRATALSLEELRSVEETFGDDARGFTSLALNTYCPN